MSKIEGRAKKYDGTAIDYVSIFNWSDGKCIAQIKPAATGVWSLTYGSALHVGIAYIADGCEPIAHGPYTFQGINPAYKIFYQSFNTTSSVANNDAVTLHGGASIDTSVSKFGAGSLRILSANRYALTGQLPAIGLDDYCIEFFVKTARTSRMTFIDTRYGGNSNGISWQIFDDKLVFFANGSYLVNDVLTPELLALLNVNSWLHMAATRENGVLRVFMGGVKVAQSTDSNNYASCIMMIGNNANAPDLYYISGHMDEVTISKGDARYTENYAIPTKSFY